MFVARSWTAEEDEILINFQGTDNELAEKLNRTKKSISTHRRRLRDKGLIPEVVKPEPKPKPEKKKKAKKKSEKKPVEKKSKNNDGIVDMDIDENMELDDTLELDFDETDEMPKPVCSYQPIHLSRDKNDFDEYPACDKLPKELRLDKPIFFDIDAIIEHTLNRRKFNQDIYKGVPYVRTHAIEMLQYMSDDEQKAIAEGIGIDVYGKSRKERMKTLLGDKALLEELYRY